MTGGQVYRAFDRSGRLLYVGCSVSAESRYAYHEQHAPWWLFHDRIDVEDFPTREEAAAAEARAIATEHPRWNVQGRSEDHPDGWCSTVQRAHWLDYERDVNARHNRLATQEAKLLREIRNVRMALAGVRYEVEAIKDGREPSLEDIA